MTKMLLDYVLYVAKLRMGAMEIVPMTLFTIDAIGKVNLF